LVFSTNKTDHHNITEILLKVALNTIKQTNMHITFDRIIQGRRSRGWKIMFSHFFWGRGLGLRCLTPLSTAFQLFMAVSFIDGGNRRTRRKPPTCHNKSLTNFIT
jgi:hypothetical protein